MCHPQIKYLQIGPNFSKWIYNLTRTMLHTMISISKTVNEEYLAQGLASERHDSDGEGWSGAFAMCIMKALHPVCIIQ